MKPVVMESDAVVRAGPDERTAWKLGFLSGLVITAIGALDVALLFYPPQWASLEWEFGTISQFIEGMPLLTMGIGAMVACSTATDWARIRRLMSVGAFLMALLVLIMLVIFALDLPAAFRALPTAAMKSTLKVSVFKTVSMSTMYLVFYATLGVWTWRRLKLSKGAS